MMLGMARYCLQKRLSPPRYFSIYPDSNKLLTQVGTQAHRYKALYFGRSATLTPSGTRHRNCVIHSFSRISAVFRVRSRKGAHYESSKPGTLLRCRSILRSLGPYVAAPDQSSSGSVECALHHERTLPLI